MSSLFKKAETTSAYLKAGLMGFAGSGKTYTATELAIGLVKLMKAKKLPGADKPVFFIDTETGSDWQQPRFEADGIELQVLKSKSFADLAQAMKEAQEHASVLIIDSITAFWIEFTETYQRVKKRTRGLEFQDWAYLKKEWRAKFTEPFVNSPLHVILCGRAGFEYEHYTDEAGKKQIEKSGVKMKAEGELGFEPSLLVFMEREQDLDKNRVIHVAHVYKDRRTDSKSLDGKSFTNPKFKDFLPHIEFLNLGGQQLGVDASRNSAAIIETQEGRDQNSLQRKIVLDEIESLLVSHFPSTGAVDKKAKVDLIRKHFKAAWTEIELVMPLFDLRVGYDGLHQELEGGPSRYAIKPAEPVNDEIPHMDAPPMPEIVREAAE
jgi:hypothetical protein